MYFLLSTFEKIRQDNLLYFVTVHALPASNWAELHSIQSALLNFYKTHKL